MAKRNAGNAAKAVDGGSRVVYAAAQAKAEARDITQKLAERMAEAKFADMMAAGGVGHDRMALELLYWLPRDFLDLYQELYMRGLANTDGGTGARGSAQRQTAAVGKAAANTAAGQKKFKRYWVVQDEEALELKERIDKRLRSITREIRDELTEMDFLRSRRGTEKEARVKTATGKSSGKFKIARGICGECGILMAKHWRYCPRCGCPTSSK